MECPQLRDSFIHRRRLLFQSLKGVFYTFDTLDGFKKLKLSRTHTGVPLDSKTYFGVDSNGWEMSLIDMFTGKVKFSRSAGSMDNLLNSGQLFAIGDFVYLPGISLMRVSKDLSSAPKKSNVSVRGNFIAGVTSNQNQGSDLKGEIDTLLVCL